jgi:hypothetical protein
MPTPADLRLRELLEKWLTSLELHAKYSALDDSNYAKIQSWPEHQRPSRWIIDLAIQNTLTLQSQLRERIEQGDAKFSDSLELMAFLTNLVGSEHIERYIPLAEEPAAAAGTAAAAAARDAAVSWDAAVSGAAAGTAETPAFSESVPLPPPPASAPAAREGVASRSGGNSERGTPSAAVREQVIVDAVGLVQAGHKWYELAEIISAMTDRPHLTDVRRILKDNKDAIDQKAGRG